MEYANIIVDISIDKLDRTFQYRIPEALKGKLQEGMQVMAPFGNREITGYVVELTDVLEFESTKIRPLTGICQESVTMEAQLIALAAWMKRNYGGTMNQALKTVLPVKQKKNTPKQRTLYLSLPQEKAKKLLAQFESSHYTAKARLLRELIAFEKLDYTVVRQKLNVTPSVIRSLEEKKVLQILSQENYRNPVASYRKDGQKKQLNGEQKQVVEQILSDWNKGEAKTYLLKGVTGSGKTEVYIELIEKVMEGGKQAIVLIPEIALTYQTVTRFYSRFGDRVSIMNSRMTPAERYDQFLRAKNGDIDIMIGPRSALFTPFPRIGLIIIDEEHENSYKSETVPKYHARETAICRAQMNHASVLLGSATPSVESYFRARNGIYKLLELNNRAASGELPECEIVDLREELKAGNRSILSRKLQLKIAQRLERKEQIMLFLNRRGIAGFVSCRECGHVVKCPHCDVALCQHNRERLVCHYCGYEQPEMKLCPECGSKYIGGFKAGTQKIEEIVQKQYPAARVLRMDFDTTRNKDAYEKILSAFANQEADILIGTQMIVKGHDFPKVTLVGVIAADLSLYPGDFHGAEKTFQLLTQAEGRAGRGGAGGEAVIQTYQPGHFAICAARNQDYEAFYEREIAYRQLLHYPPVWHMLVILFTSYEEALAQSGAETIRQMLSEDCRVYNLQCIGPADAAVGKINDVFRKVLYLKTEEMERLVVCKDKVEGYIRDRSEFKKVSVQFDFDPASGT